MPPENVRCEGQAKAAALRSGLRSPRYRRWMATKKAEAAEAAAATQEPPPPLPPPPSEPMDVEELAAALRFDMAWSKEVKARCRAEAAGPHPKPRGRAPLGADGRRKCWDKDNGGWQDHVLVLPMLLPLHRRRHQHRIRRRRSCRSRCSHLHCRHRRQRSSSEAKLSARQCL